MHNIIAHLLTNAQPHLYTPNQPAFQVTSPISLSGMTSCSVQYPFGCFGSPVLAVLLQFFFLVFLIGRAQDLKKVLNLV